MKAATDVVLDRGTFWVLVGLLAVVALAALAAALAALRAARAARRAALILQATRARAAPTGPRHADDTAPVEAARAGPGEEPYRIEVGGPGPGPHPVSREPPSQPGEVVPGVPPEATEPSIPPPPPPPPPVGEPAPSERPWFVLPPEAEPAAPRPAEQEGEAAVPEGAELAEGQPGGPAAARLRRLEDPDPFVRIEAIEEIRGHPELADALIRALQDEYPVVRRQAVRALRDAGGQAAARALVEVASQDPSAEVREEAVAALAWRLSEPDANQA